MDSTANKDWQNVRQLKMINHFDEYFIRGKLNFEKLILSGKSENNLINAFSLPDAGSLKIYWPYTRCNTECSA